MEDLVLLQICLGRWFGHIHCHFFNYFSSYSIEFYSALERSDERKKLQLSPKTFEDASEVKTSKPKLSDDAVKRKSKNIIEEYFSIHDKEVKMTFLKHLCTMLFILFI